MDMQHPDAQTASAEADREGGSGCDQVEHRELKKAQNTKNGENSTQAASRTSK